MIFISHRLREVLEIADFITVLKDGKKVGTISRDEASEEKLIQMMIGRQLSDLFPPRSTGNGQRKVILNIENLSVEEKVHNVSFSVEKKKILGIGGLEGQGQSELLKSLFGLEKRKSGRIFLEGKEIFVRSPEEAKQNGMALIPEDRQEEGIFPLRSVRENLAVATLSLIHISEPTRPY